MIKSGITSITLRSLKPFEIVELVVQAELNAIEWGGDIHVPHGDLKCAEAVRRLTLDAGLMLPSYGSYYFAGVTEEYNPEFPAVLDTALVLGVDTIRVWAGKKNWEDNDNAGRRQIINDLQRISDMCLAQDITIACEYHNNSLTNTAKNTLKLLNEVSCHNFKTYWQPKWDLTCNQNMRDLKCLLPSLKNIHVFHWWPDYKSRCLLSEGIEAWKDYISIAKGLNRDIFALIEFVKEDEPESFLLDAFNLKNLLTGSGPWD